VISFIPAPLRGALLFLSLLSVPFQSWGYNSHEHYTSLANYGDYDYAFQKVGEDLDNQTLGEIDDPVLGKRDGITENCSLVFKHVFNIDIDLEVCKKFTFDKAARKIANELQIRRTSCPSSAQANGPEMVSPSRAVVNLIPAVKKAFFEFNRLNSHNPQSMEMIGWDVRSQTQKLLTQLKSPDGHSGIYYLFQSYLENTPVEDRRLLTLSISANTLKNPESQKALSELSGLFARYLTKVEFFIVWQRNRLIRDAENDDMKEFDSIMSQLEGTKKTGEISNALTLSLIQGFDLVGSLHEANEIQTHFKTSDVHPSQEKLALIRSRMKSQLERIINLPNKNRGLQLKLHAWEMPGTALPTRTENLYEGEFYTILKESLRNQLRQMTTPSTGTDTWPVKLRQIRIGHIGGLNLDSDLKFFQSISEETQTKFLFEANIFSNKKNHSADIKSLVNTIDILLTNNFEVLLGTDGVGIMTSQNAHFNHTLETLDRYGLSKPNIEKLQKLAKYYINGEKYSRHYYNSYVNSTATQTTRACSSRVSNHDPLLDDRGSPFLERIYNYTFCRITEDDKIIIRAALPARAPGTEEPILPKGLTREECENYCSTAKR